MKNKGKYTPALLEANAEKIEPLTYSKPLTPEELEAITQEFISKTLEVNHQIDTLEELKDRYKDILKPLKKDLAEKLDLLKTKQRTVTETVYLVVDEEQGRMVTYTKDGEEIQSRKLLPEEKQHRLRI